MTVGRFDEANAGPPLLSGGRVWAQSILGTVPGGRSSVGYESLAEGAEEFGVHHWVVRRRERGPTTRKPSGRVPRRREAN